MVDALNCSQCGRPLQRGRSSCIYCGREFTEEELKIFNESQNEEAVRRRLAEADAVLEASPSAMLGSKGRVAAKIIIIALSLAAFLFISWISGWEPALMGLSAILFALPIWQVLRKL